MFECRQCLWRCIRAILSDATHVPLQTARVPRLPRSRNIHTSAGRALSIAVRSEERAIKLDDAIQFAGKKVPARSAPSTTRSHNDDGLTPAQRRHAKLESPWLQGDRLKLLKRVKNLLMKGDREKALALVRVMSQSQACTISWNAIINDLLESKKVVEAFKIYNEMKKRGQPPDSFTYSNLFNGLVLNKKTPGVAQRAVKLWQSLSNPNSRVKPSILLTNAALRVCASANDIDAVWTIAGSIPEYGPDTADNITYTTILNAMRYNTEIEPNVKATEQQQEASDTTLTQGRQVWEEVVGRWKASRMDLDENLVCAMGRLLLSGRHAHDWDDIFSLVAQTMNIPRQTRAREARNTTDVEHAKRLPVPVEESSSAVKQRHAAGNVVKGSRRDLLPVSKNSGTVVQPTNNTLTLLVEACQKMYLKAPAEAYWKLLTSSEGLAILPDSVSYHAYLRLLRQFKASGEAIRLIRDSMKDIEPATGTFRIAMSTCVRNQLSPNIMMEATELMNIMLKRLKYLDLKTSIMYMNLALGSPRKDDTLTAVQLLTPQHARLQKLLNNGTPAEQAILLELSKLVISGFDRVIDNSKKGGEDSVQNLQQSKAVWTTAVQKVMHGRQRDETDETANPALVARENALSRYERKKTRDQMRAKRRVVSIASDKARERQKSKDLPVLPSEV